jgi:hypothetical protein
MATTTVNHGAAVRRFMLAVALCLTPLSSALADVRILASPGGTVGNYLNFFSQVRRSGERVIIDGPCMSACTLVLSTIPRNRICVTSRAVLGFHAPQILDEKGRTSRSREATRAVTAVYPPAIRAWIMRHGGLRQKMLILRGRELTALYRHC